MTRDEARQFLQSLYSFMAEHCADDSISVDEDRVIALVANEKERCATIAETYFDWHDTAAREHCEGNPSGDIAAKIRSGE